MVGLADLRVNAGKLKTCRMSVSGKYCYFYLSGLTTYDFLDVLNYKSWVYKTYQKTVTVRYVNIIKGLEKGNVTFRTNLGFGPLLLRYLSLKGFQINDADLEPYRSRIVVFPDLKIKLWDFQERMVNDWLSVGGIGVIKSATGSGKCCTGETLILTDKGLIKIEDIVKGISDSKNVDISQKNLYDSFCNFREKFEDNDNIKNLDNVVSISSKLNYSKYHISGKYDMKINDIISLRTSMGYGIRGTPEHKIVVIDNNGDLIFKKLGDITKEDNIAISYDSNIFNDRLKLNYRYKMRYKDVKKNILENIGYMDEDIATLLGYAIAEGSDALYEEKNLGHVTITNYDEEIVDDTIRICQHLKINASRSEYDGKMTGVTISSVEMVYFLYYLGYRHGAKNKEIPWSILQADKKSQIAFIRALFDCDGTVYQKSGIVYRGEEEGEEKEKSKELVEYYSSSHELCRQLQLLLLNMGIIARLNDKKGAILEYRGEIREYEKSYRLSITGGEIIKFAEIIGFGLKRKQHILDACVSILKNRERWTDVTYPNIDKKLNILYNMLKLLGKRGQIIKTWQEDFELGGKKIKITRKKKISSYEYLNNCDFNRPMWAYISGERSPSKDTLEKILHILSPTENTLEYRYLQLLSKRFIIDKVDTIEKEKDNVYDVTIDDIHSYIGNGMVNHNTIIGCRAIKDIGRKTLILVHTSDLLINVWNESLVKSFGKGIMSQVGIVGGGLTDIDRMTMKIGARTGDFNENIRKDIVIATFQTLNNRLNEISEYKFGLMICDEAHHCPSNMFRKVNSVIRAPYKLGLSATFERLDGMTKEVFGQLGDIQSSVSIRELINRGILAEPRFQSPIIIDKDIIEDIEHCGYGGLNLSRYVKKMSASSTKKKDYIVNICKNIAARGRRFLLFTDYVNAEDVYIRDMYVENLLHEGVKVTFIDQEMSSDERSTVFKFLDRGEISGIVFGKLGSEGVNIPSVDAVVMANGLKSPITYTQRVGRAMRRVPGKEWCDIFEILIDTPMELKWSEYNFSEYKMEGFQKLTYKVE